MTGPPPTLDTTLAFASMPCSLRKTVQGWGLAADRARLTRGGIGCSCNGGCGRLPVASCCRRRAGLCCPHGACTSSQAPIRIEAHLRGV